MKHEPFFYYKEHSKWKKGYKKKVSHVNNIEKIILKN